jgi:MPBQ/MSBQ methyltransferase
MNGNQSLAHRLKAQYDSGMYVPLVQEYFDYSGFHNYGYWGPRTQSQRQASETLVDVLVESMPEKSGAVLDVACGMGASTNRLLRSFAPSDVIGINISDKQIDTCRRRVPGCRFLKMDAIELRFRDDCIGNILCVEAAFHFETREMFLREACRVLKPGGCLALSDILLSSRHSASVMAKKMPVANFIADVEQYRQLYYRCGFDDVRVVPAQAECWEACRDHWLAFVYKKVLGGRAHWTQLHTAAIDAWCRDQLFNNYLLVSAIKPARFAKTSSRRRRGSDIRKYS